MLTGPSLAILAMAVAQSQLPAPGSPHEYVHMLAGPWSEVRERPIWGELGIDAEALVWSKPSTPAALPIYADLRYQDVDRDGLADAIVAVYASSDAYFYLAPALDLTSWAAPIELGHCRYDLWDYFEDADELPSRFWPESAVVGGRVLVGVLNNSGLPINTDRTDTVFQYENGGLTEIARYVGRADGGAMSRWRIAPTGTNDDLLFYTYRADRHGAPLGPEAFVLPTGGHELRPIDHPDEAIRIAMHRAAPPPPEPPAGLHEVHPLRVAHELAGFPIEVVQRPIWQRLHVDPAKHELQQDEVPTDEERAQGRWYVWHLNPSVDYADFHRNGLPGAFVSISQGFGTWWVVLHQPEPGVWTSLGMLDELASEHGLGSRTVPEVQIVGGRTFVLARSGVMMDFYSEVYQTIFLLEEGKLIPLWKELTSGHGHKHTARDQAVELRETPDGVVLEVKTGKDSMYNPKGDEPESVRRWILRPRLSGLEPLP